jgi:hypothetical protein
MCPTNRIVFRRSWIALLLLLFCGLVTPTAVHADPIPIDDPLFSIANRGAAPVVDRKPSKAVVRQRQATFGVVAVMLASTVFLSLKLASRRSAIGQHRASTWRVDAPSDRHFAHRSRLDASLN